VEGPLSFSDGFRAKARGGAIFATAIVLTIFIAACGKSHSSSSSSGSASSASASGTPGKFPFTVITPSSTPATGASSGTGGGSSGSAGAAATPAAGGPIFVSTSVQTSCDTSGDQAAIKVNYSATARGGNITRVQLVDNGKVVDDSGPINQGAYQHIVTIKAPFGELHTYQVKVEAPGATGAAQVSSSVQCAPPPPPPGPHL
jgi:hypothetical protein